MNNDCLKSDEELTAESLTTNLEFALFPKNSFSEETAADLIPTTADPYDPHDLILVNDSGFNEIIRRVYTLAAQRLQ